MRTLELDLLGTLALATLLFFIGQFIVQLEGTRAHGNHDPGARRSGTVLRSMTS